MEKAIQILEQGDIEYLPQYSAENHYVFEVEASSRDEPYNIEIGRWNEMTCDCQYSLNHGHKGQLCSHRIAVMMFASVHTDKLRATTEGVPE